MKDIIEKFKQMDSNKKKLWVSFLLNAFIVIVCILCRPISEAGDDNVMMSIASGFFGHPDNHLVFINIIHSTVLQRLTMIIPHVNWYMVIMFSLLMISFTILTYIILDSFSNKVSGVILLAITFTFSIDAYLAYQFTKCAGIFTAVGIFFLVHCVKRKKAASFYLLGILFVLLGSFYRYLMSLVVIFFIFGCLLVFELIEFKGKRSEYNRDHLYKFSILFISLIILIASGRSMDIISRNNDGWNPYYHYNSYRGQIRDYYFIEYSENVDFYKSLGLSENDYNNLKIWNISDPDVYTLDRFKAIVNETEQQQNGNSTDFQVSQLVIFLFNAVIKNKYFIVVSVLFLFLLYYAQQRKLYIVRGLVVLLGILSLNAFLFVMGRYGINRVDFCIWFASIVLLFINSYYMSFREIEINTRDTNKFYKFIGCGILVCTALRMSVHSIETYEIKRDQNDYFQLLNYVDSHKKNNYFIDASSTHYGYAEAWDSPKFGYDHNNMIWLGGWLTNSPLVLHQWENRNITNPFKDMCNQPHSYYICRYQSNMDILIEYLRENYDQNISMKTVRNYGAYVIYKIE